MDDETESGALGAGPIVLLADDDRQFLKTFSGGLERFGFRVVPAASVDEALARASEFPRPDILVADIELGDGWGATLALDVQRLDPRIKVMYISGHAGGDPILRQGIEEHMVFLDKPFTVPQLVEAIGRALGSERTPEAPAEEEEEASD
ncbi:MAG: response regulator [Gemmatimonadota bacterium]|jgi:two-component system nitrogen regulation response regulator GlnG